MEEKYGFPTYINIYYTIKKYNKFNIVLTYV